ncbi:MAG: hypothetical protein J2P26_08355, partial [Nocardiopsaceae bacterium]|nr:hypothetical protein [Nocardiopsaceae bacterium]
MLRSGLGFALGSLTTRGRCFVAAGAVVAASGAALGQPDLLRIGALLIVVPVLSAFGAVRAERRLARYRLTCTRQAAPARLRPGQRAWVTLRLSG